ncbi:hypothetical protein [Bradyrhizobium sp. Leo121]|uniref:hypothetical protein n=1 Tax=Bradyrhizobium sp. Leo121 TaxID=1571195 RepID=UPI001029B194|nr:hypothetical protein [Bradyrhizobium sp. Leo121]RZN13908.1 hypothetical protein CWO90_43965 [Bradyrhizobium sp. Leo121]
MINDIITSIEDRFTASFEWLFDPLVYWFGIALLILIACIVISYFAPFKWIRAALGGVLVIVGAFLAGGVEMHKIMNRKLQEEKEKQKQREAEARAKDGGGWFKW